MIDAVTAGRIGMVGLVASLMKTPSSVGLIVVSAASWGTLRANVGDDVGKVSEPVLAGPVLTPLVVAGSLLSLVVVPRPVAVDWISLDGIVVLKPVAVDSMSLDGTPLVSESSKPGFVLVPVRRVLNVV